MAAPVSHQVGRWRWLLAGGSLLFVYGWLTIALLQRPAAASPAEAPSPDPPAPDRPQTTPPARAWLVVYPQPAAAEVRVDGVSFLADSGQVRVPVGRGQAVTVEVAAEGYLTESRRVWVQSPVETVALSLVALPGRPSAVAAAAAPSPRSPLSGGTDPWQLGDAAEGVVAARLLVDEVGDRLQRFLVEYGADDNVDRQEELTQALEAYNVELAERVAQVERGLTDDQRAEVATYAQEKLADPLARMLERMEQSHQDGVVEPEHEDEIDVPAGPDREDVDLQAPEEHEGQAL